MNFFSFLRRKIKAKTIYNAPKAQLRLDTLEDRGAPDDRVATETTA